MISMRTRLFFLPRSGASCCTQVTKSWAGKPQRIASVAMSASEIPTQMTLNEPASTKIVCFKSVAAACRAKWLQTTPIDGSGLPRNTERMLCLFHVGSAGEGKDSVAADASGKLTATKVTPVAVAPLPGKHAAFATPRARFFVPGGFKHALD